MTLLTLRRFRCIIVTKERGWKYFAGESNRESNDISGS